MSKVVTRRKKIPFLYSIITGTLVCLCSGILSSAPYQIYFTQPLVSTNTITSPQKSFDELLIDFINAAQQGQKLYIAVYNLSRPNIKTAVLNAVARLGEKNVYLIYEKSNEINFNNVLGSGKITQFIDDGTTDSNKLMHNKFVVIKDSAVWTGSYNFTYDSTFHDNNNAIIIWSKELAQCYENEFLNMYNNNLFGFAKSTATLQPDWNGKEIDIGDGINVKVCFSPYNNPGKINQIILDELGQAKENICFNIYTFGVGTGLDDKLVQCRNRNIDVRGVLETDQVYSSYMKMSDAGVSVILDNNKGLLHHKFAVIDFNRANATVMTGSNNWTNTANEYNDENMLIINSAKVACAYYSEFKKNYQSAGVKFDIHRDAIVENVIIYPSPARNIANIKYKISDSVNNIKISVYNIVGEKVKDIVPASIYPGYYNETVWNSDNNSGEKVVSGIYLVKITAESTNECYSIVRKLAIIK